MSLWKRLKNLWYISGLDFRPSPAQKEAKRMLQPIVDLVTGKKMATIIDMKDQEDLFPNEEEQ